MPKHENRVRVELFFSSGRHTSFDFKASEVRVTVGDKLVILEKDDRKVTIFTPKLDYLARLDYKKELTKPASQTLKPEDDEDRSIDLL